MIPTIQRGESKSPFKGESFRPFFSPHKKGRARRGMSDKIKIIYNLIDVLNCNQHSYNPSDFATLSHPLTAAVPSVTSWHLPTLWGVTPYTGEAGGSTNLRPSSEGGKRWFIDTLKTPLIGSFYLHYFAVSLSSFNFSIQFLQTI